MLGERRLMIHKLMEFIVKAALTCIAVAILLIAVSFVIGLGPVWAVIAIGLGVFVTKSSSKDGD